MNQLEYQKYLHSPHWHRVRKAMYRLHPACENCGQKKDLNVHHVTYVNLGQETSLDLVVVCHDCHQLLHAGEIRVNRRALLQKRLQEGRKRSILKQVIRIVRSLFSRERRRS